MKLVTALLVVSLVSGAFPGAEFVSIDLEDRATVEVSAELEVVYENSVGDQWAHNRCMVTVNVVDWGDDKLAVATDDGFTFTREGDELSSQKGRLVVVPDGASEVSLPAVTDDSRVWVGNQRGEVLVEGVVEIRGWSPDEGDIWNQGPVTPESECVFVEGDSR